MNGSRHVLGKEAMPMPFSRKPGEGVQDICDVYVAIAVDLKDRGL